MRIRRALNLGRCSDYLIGKMKKNNFGREKSWGKAMGYSAGDADDVVEGARLETYSTALAAWNSPRRLNPQNTSRMHTRISPLITGLPHHGVPYFFISQRYDTSVADSLLSKHGITCPRFDEYVGSLLDFVDEFPKL